MKKLIRDLKIRYYEYRVRRLKKSIMFYEQLLASSSTLMVDIPRYKSLKKSTEVELNETYDKLYKLIKEDIMGISLRI